MNKQEAFNIIVQAVAGVSTDLKGHQTIQTAVQVIAKEIGYTTESITEQGEENGTEEDNNK